MAGAATDTPMPDVHDADKDTKMEEEPKAAKNEPGKPAADEDDDPVVMEYTVHLSNQLIDHLHLFQYPLRPPNRGYDLNKCTKMRMLKPTGVGDERVPGNFDRFNMEIDPKKQSTAMLGEEEAQEQKGVVSQSYCLTSQRTRNKTNYAIGVVRGGMLHMTGLTNIHQFRPDVDANKAMNQEEEKTTTVEKKVEASMTAKVAYYEDRNRSVWLEKVKKDTHTFDMHLSPSTDADAKQTILNRLFAPDKPVKMHPAHTTTIYLNQLFKKTKDRWLMERNAKIPLALRSEFRWQLQAASIVAAAKVAKYETIKALLRAQHQRPLPPDDEILAYLLTCCVVIKGLFVVKQDCDHGPTEALAREWILRAFWESEDEYVKRADLMSPPFRLPIDHKTFKAVLETVAVMTPNEDWRERKWCLKAGGCDYQFVQQFPKVAKREDDAWRAQRDKMIHGNACDPMVRNPRLCFAWQMPPKDGTRVAAQGGQGASVQDQVKKWLLLSFQRNPVWNKQILITAFNKACKQSTNFSCPPEEFMRILDVATMKFGDGLILAKRGAEVDKYRPAYIRLLQERSTWNKQELEAEVGEVPKHHAAAILQELGLENGRDISARPPAIR